MNYIVLVTSFILPVILLQKVNWISKNTSENDLYNLEEFDDDIIAAAIAATATDDDDGNVINTDIKNDDDDDDIYANAAAVAAAAVTINHERVLLTNDVSNIDINIFNNNDEDDDKGNIPSTTTKNENHNKRGHTRYDDDVNVDNNRNTNDDDNNDNTDDDDGSHDSNSNNDILLNMSSLSDINLSQKYESRRFKNILLDGGNAKAISYIGAFKAFADLGYFQNDQYTFTQISGTSTSCLMGFIMGLDIHPQILETLVYNLNVVAKLINFNIKYLLDDQFQQNSDEETSWFDNIKNSYNLLNKNNEFIKLWKYRNSPGLSTERALLKLIYSHILKKSPHYKKFKRNETLTFEKIYKITGHKLACFVTNLSKRTLVELSYTKTPNENILNAIYASLTIPGLFKPLQNDDFDILIDGSYLNSFPMSMVSSDNDQAKTLGLSLNVKTSPAAIFNEKPNHNKNLMEKQQNSKKLQNSQLNLKEIDTLEYVQLLHKLLLYKNQQQLQHQQYENDIIYLNSPIEALSYNISATMISMAINRAYLNVITFFK